MSNFNISISGDRWRYSWKPRVIVVDKKSNDEKWGLLCTYVNTDVIIKWRKGYQCRYRSTLLGNCIDINADTERCCSISTYVVLSSTYVNAEADTERCYSVTVLTSTQMQNNVVQHLHLWSFHRLTIILTLKQYIAVLLAIVSTSM